MNKTKENAREKRYKTFEVLHGFRCKHQKLYMINVIKDLESDDNVSPMAIWTSYDGLKESSKKKYDDLVDVGAIYKCSQDCSDPEKVKLIMQKATI